VGEPTPFLRATIIDTVPILKDVEVKIARGCTENIELFVEEQEFDVFQIRRVYAEVRKSFSQSESD